VRPVVAPDVARCMDELEDADREADSAASALEGVPYDLRCMSELEEADSVASSWEGGAVYERVWRGR